MNAGANRLSILYDLWIKSCTSLLWKSRLCLCEIRKRHLMNIVINLIKYTVQQFNRKEEWITWPPVPHKHSFLTSYFRYLDVFVLTEAAENLEVRSWVSERTNTRNISQTFPLPKSTPNITTMPNIREKLKSGKQKLTTGLATGKEKMRAGGEKLKLKVCFFFSNLAPCCLLVGSFWCGY